MRPLVLAALVFTVAACDSTGGGWPFPGSEVDPSAGVTVADAAALAEARMAWEAAEPDGYWLRYETLCFCAPLVTDVRVVGGEVVETRFNGEPPPDDPAVEAFTVDGLYDQAARAFAEADGSVVVRVLPGAPRLPVSVSIDWIAQAADDEVAYRILAFAPLEVAER